MNKYFQTAFIILLVSGLMVLYGRLGLHGQTWFIDDSHFLKIGVLGVCGFMVGVGFILAGLLLGGKEE